ncbi:Phage tail length tape-measure protein [Enterococcus phage VPE25]|nr:Phage tail length tape-measure protein [Enterococcus phage VPE25]
MQYSKEDLKKGTKLRCIKANPEWWTKGKIYEVAFNEDGILQITDDAGQGAFMDYILDCLNEKHRPVQFEIVEYPFVTITEDIEQQLINRIEALQTERKNIFDKMDRMQAQQYKLQNKIKKLNDAKNALKVLKEFK